MDLKSSSINLWRQILGTSSSKFINSIGVVLLIIVLNFEFSVDEIGLYFFLFGVVDFLSNIAGGIGKALRRRVSARKGKQSDYLTTALATTFFMQIIITVFIVLIALLFPRPLLPDILKGLNLELMLGALLMLVAQSTGKIMINYNSGLGYPSRSGWLGKAFPGTLFFVFSVGIIYMNLDLVYIFIAGALSYGVSTLLMLLTTRPRLRSKPSIGNLKSLLRFGKWSIPNKIMMNFYGSLDIIVLGILISSTAVGYYESSNSLAHIVFTIPHGVGAVLSVKISGLDAEGKDEQIREIISKTLPISVFIPIGALFLFLIFGEVTLDLVYGTEFVAAYAFLIGLSVKEILSGYWKPIHDLNYGLDRPKVPFTANFYSVLSNVITVLPLIYFFGGIGVVISTVVAEVVRLALLWNSTSEYLQDVDHLSLVRPFIVAIPVGTLFWFIRNTVQSGSMILIAIQAVSFAVVYVSAFYLLLNKRD